MILLLESLHPEAEAALAAEGTLVRATDPNLPPDELGEVRAIVTRGRGRIPADLIARCPVLRVVGRAGAGLDNVDTAAAAARGIAVVFAPGANASTVAEHTLALMLDLARGITRTARAVAAGRWEERAHYRGDELAGRTLGVVGFGNIGQRVAALAGAFGMNVFVAQHTAAALEGDLPADPGGPRPAPAPAPEPEPVLAKAPCRGVPEREAPERQAPVRQALRELLGFVDVVTLHVPLTPATRGLIGRHEVASMKRGALLVNTARGALVDTVAVRDALASGHLGGFAADVLDVQPPDEADPLLARDDVVLTPHVASLTAATYRALCLSTARNVVRVLRGEAPEPRSLFVTRQPAG